MNAPQALEGILNEVYNKSKSGKVGYYCPHCTSSKIQRFSLGGEWKSSRKHQDGKGNRFKRGEDSYRCFDCMECGPWRCRVKNTLQPLPLLK